ncbi:MAG: hypothetical protein JNG85_03230 [Spirochaetaceae bacterium]|nr:hypothetical protein [Spirochaetaceae bacterium]
MSTDPATLLVEARGVVEEADRAGLRLRLLGGVAIKLRCPSSAAAPFARVSSDADYAASGPAAPLEAFFSARGFVPDREFNLYNGHERLLFTSPSGVKTDVFVGAFKMCHQIPFDNRLALDPLSLPLAELILTKLQVVEANEKDLSDAACILADHEVGTGDGDTLNAGRVAELCAADWGLWRTTCLGLEKLLAWTTGAALGDAARARVAAGAAALADRLAAEPKPLAWRLRAAVGDRVRWYEIPEEAER